MFKIPVNLIVLAVSVLLLCPVVQAQDNSSNALEALDKALDAAGKSAPTPGKAAPQQSKKENAATSRRENAQDMDMGQETLFVKLVSDAAVLGGPTSRVIVEVKRTMFVTKIWTYHFNGGRGAEPGSISLVDLESGTTVGSWPAVGTYHMFDSSPGSSWPEVGDGPPFLYWTVKPGVILRPGKYEVRDSDPGSWSQNQETGGRGVAWVYGIPR